MARKATGQVISPNGKQKSWAIRFTAYRKRRQVSLGRPQDGWNRQRAEAELENVLADVRRGIWQPHQPEPVTAPAGSQTFHEFASEWLANREPELRPKTIASYRWQLSDHLLPHFASMPVSGITAVAVDAYKAGKLREGRIGANQINKTLGTLARILKAARRYGLLDSNPLEDVDRLRGTRPRPVVPDPEQLPALLDTAGPLRPILATFAGAGLRNGEACALDWRDVNLASGTIRVRESKTHAGVRLVDLPLALREELSDHKARSPKPGPNDPVFTNRDGRRQTVSNIERRFKTAIRRANERLCELGVASISEKATPHSLRHLYASLRAAVGDDPVYIAEQGGWTDPAFALRVYARAVRRRERLTGAALREFDGALQWAEMGRIHDPVDTLDALPDSAEPPIAGVERSPSPGPDSSAG